MSGPGDDLIRKLIARGSDIAAKTTDLARSYADGKVLLAAALDYSLGDGKEMPGIWSVDNAVIDQAPDSLIVAVDGAMVCDNRAVGDLCAAVGVALGMEENNIASDVFLDSVARSMHNREVTAGIMASIEIELASQAASKGDIVFLYGALIADLIAVSKAIAFSFQLPPGNPLRDRIAKCRSAEFRACVLQILESNNYMAIPKYVTKNDFAEIVPDQFRMLDSKSIATMALNAGQMTRFRSSREAFLGTTPLPPAGEEKQRKNHEIGSAFGFSQNEIKHISELIEGIHSCFYKPHAWTPAFRIDIPKHAAADPEIWARILKSLRDSTRDSGMMEPLPQFLVDQFAKQISFGVEAVREMTALASIDDPELRLLLAMGYRT